MKIISIVNPLLTLKIDDSTIEILKESIKRHHETFVIERDDLFFDRQKIFGNAIEGKEALLYFGGKTKSAIKRKIDLSQSDAILMRQDPPFDEDFIYITYLLELIKDKVFILNDPVSVRNANEKFFPMQFSKLIPETLISKSDIEIKKFLTNFKDGIVIKPLNNRGGNGIFYVHSKDVNKNEIIKIVTNNGKNFVMIQKFLKETRNGDKRITLLDGKILNCCIRIPHKEDFRGNLGSGATIKKSQVTKQEKDMIKIVAPVLTKMNIHLAGIDIIGGLITEINTTSPFIANMLFQDAASKVVDFIEEKTSTKI